MYLNITTTAGCRGKCVYCPQDLFQKAMEPRPAFLTAAEFADLLPALRDTHFQAFSFGGFSECFDNPDIIDLLDMVQRQDNVEEIWIYTNGEAVTPEVVQQLARIPIARFDVSCHGFDARVYQRTRPFIDSNKVRGNLLYLLEHRPSIARLAVSVTGPFGSERDRSELAALCQAFGAFLEIRKLHGRAGLLKIGQPAVRKQGPFRCAKFAFDKPVLVPGGDLSLCCQDFSLSYIIGNLHRDSFQTIMTHSALRQHVLAVARGTLQDPELPCYQCEFCVPC
jgi:hypothetical protein